MGPLLAIFPHPDDETFTAGGIMAAAAEQGMPVTVISATRGEAGESSVPGLDPNQLGALREKELREAMHALGVSDVRLLGYRDSGMEGSEEANHPNAFVRVPVATAVARLVPLIRAIRPEVVLTYGADGIYGHPDHRHIYEAAVAAVEAAGNPAYDDASGAAPWQTPALYFGTAPREDLLAMLDRPDSPLASISAEARAQLGTPRSEITYEIDISPWAERKRVAFLAHRTQIGEGGPLSGMPEERQRDQLAREYVVRAPLPWNAGDGEPDIVERLARGNSGQ
jgi:LmbE family N-acetylglucosaminyl deacetylase